jgi:hypothetical protein
MEFELEIKGQIATQHLKFRMMRKSLHILQHIVRQRNKEIRSAIAVRNRYIVRTCIREWVNKLGELR